MSLTANEKRRISWIDEAIASNKKLGWNTSNLHASKMKIIKKAAERAKED